MNAFIQIISQLIEAVPPASWKRESFFPFPQIVSPEARLFDACIFRQDAGGALGILWVQFEGAIQLVTLPFRLARYSEAGDLISLSPWSLREASHDSELYEALRHLLHARNPVATAMGGQFSRRFSGGEPNSVAVGMFSDSVNACVRVEAQEAVKIYRRLATDTLNNQEVLILDYLTKQTGFQNCPKLISIFEYTTPAHVQNCVAISMRYIPNNGSLWQEFVECIHHSRYPKKGSEKSSHDSWNRLLGLCESLGRVVGEFHRSMVHARDLPSLIPESTMGAQKFDWQNILDARMDSLIEEISETASAVPSLRSFPKTLSSFKDKLSAKVKDIPNVGLRIRIHGNLHMGNILFNYDQLILIDFGDDTRDDTKVLQKQHCLEDLASIILSLRHSWNVNSTKAFNSLLLDVNIEALFTETNAPPETVVAPMFYSPSCEAMEAAVLKFYFNVLREDSRAAELIPSSLEEFHTVLRYLFLYRSLKECAFDLSSDRPRAQSTLQILQDFLKQTID